MHVIIPSAVAQIDSTNEGNTLVNHYHLLVVSPKENTCFCVIRMPKHLKRGLKSQFVKYRELNVSSIRHALMMVIINCS